MTAKKSNCYRLPRRAGTGAASYLFIAIVFGFGQSAVAQDVGYNIGSDSEIQLVERSDEGAYSFRVVVIKTRDQQTSISQSMGDSSREAAMPFEAYEQLWRQAMALKMTSMEDAPLENAFPGQSEFEFHFRDGDYRHEFSAYGVDYLSDTRYRELARHILSLADEYLGDKSPQ